MFSDRSLQSYITAIEKSRTKRDFETFFSSLGHQREEEEEEGRDVTK